MRLINLFVTPILLHGLESVILSKEDVRLLSAYHRTLLKHIQSLPDRTASVGVYLMVDALPLEAELDLRVLRFFGAVSRLEADNPLRQIMTRQMAIKQASSNSWFSKATEAAKKYGLNLHHHLSIPYSKESWKAITKSAIRSHWRAELLTELLAKSSIAALATFHMYHEGPNPLWLTCGSSVQRVKAATSRVKLMTGTFPLQERKARYSPTDTDPTCQLCHLEPEDASHFLTRCPALDKVREKALEIRDSIEVMDEGEWLCLVLGGVTRVHPTFIRSLEQEPPNINTRKSKTFKSRLGISVDSIGSDKIISKSAFSGVNKSATSEIDTKFNGKGAHSDRDTELNKTVYNLNICATNFCSALDRERAKLLLEEVPRKPGGDI